jgi:NAD(P)-dependent dehydrogenase (short-subunit alcohol dehydrogenase family)
VPVALVTGCSSGFGEAIAIAFAQRGYQVVATMRKRESAPPSLKALAEKKSADIVIAPLDVTNKMMRKDAIDLAIQRFGRIDVLINNAGITARGAIEDTPEDLWRAIFETNLFGPLELIRLVLPVMRQQGAASSTSPRSPRS